MKARILTVVFILCLFVGSVMAGVVGKSEYDILWKITVIDCVGNKQVYENCRITNLGPAAVSFITNQDKIATGNGKEIVVTVADGCTRVIKEQID